MWAVAPVPVSELPGVPGPAPPVFIAATLGCVADCMDWSLFPVVHVSDAEIVPGGEYVIEFVNCSNDLSSPNLVALTADWGDVLGDCAVVPCSPPNGIVEIIDVVGVLDKFTGKPAAPVKARVDVEPAVPDRIIAIGDVVRVLDAFTGDPYPFAGLVGCP